MSTITLYHRIPKEGIQGAIYVKHTHSGSSYVLSTHVRLHRGQIDLETGRISPAVENAAVEEGNIRRVEGYMHQAVKALLDRGIEPSKEAMGRAYAEVVKMETERLPRLQYLNHHSRLRELDRLRAAEQQLVEQLAAKRQEIQALEIKLGTWKGMLLSDYFERFKEDTKSTLSKRSHALIESGIRNAINFRPGIRIDQLDKKFLKELQDHLVEKARLNITVRGVIIKLRKVLYHFEEEFPLTCASARQHKLLPKVKNDNLVYLSPEELEHLQELQLERDRHRKVRDLFCFMCATGLRYSDAIRVTKSHVVAVKRRHQGKLKTVQELHITTQKKKKLVKVPLSDKALSLLKTNDYCFPAYHSASFNRSIKEVCAKIPELQYHMEITNWSGAKANTTSHRKCDLIAAHAARRTFINLCLAADVSLASIRAWVGHSDLETTLTSYTDADAVAFDQMQKMKVVA
ncbi:Site-specific recombinase XerD [Hymenobacter gelipurpurascens]|uniref:Site-specific recombinase XerD n=1 Tax=Hymenobacter gelipurpurascens TaxID=89968 RepID=A0A212TI42_9BACT|nr:tyrosine-type recombinase/integrase [Hymenobacter gelipurpurascens]SNC65491.1 Site-specific recombinase XerD [Hymenobacter gelipurpurascens]